MSVGILRLKPGADLRAAQAAVARLMPPDVKVMTRDEFVKQEHDYWDQATPIGFIFNTAMIIAFLVGIVVVHQILYAEISTHLAQYATLKAMGYTHAVHAGHRGRRLAHPGSAGLRARLGRLARAVSPDRERDRPAHDAGRREDHVGPAAHDDDVPAVRLAGHAAAARRQPCRHVLTMEPAVLARNLFHAYGDGLRRKTILHDVNIEVRPGELTLITGPSGSGKTTLLTLIGALRAVQEGSLCVAGEELNGATPEVQTRVRRRVGYVFQQATCCRSSARARTS